MTIYHRHHFIPRHAGGTDDLSNIIVVTTSKHAEFHYERWVILGDQFDRIAWLSLVGQLKNAERNILIFSEAGKRGSKVLKETNRGIFSLSKEERSNIGKKAGKVSSNKDTNIFKNKEFQRLNSIKINKIKKVRRALGLYEESDKLVSEKLKLKTKKNGHKNRAWFIEGVYSKSGNKNNTTKIECPHCNKSGQYRAMKRWHFDNCKNKK